MRERECTYTERVSSLCCGCSSSIKVSDDLRVSEQVEREGEGEGERDAPHIHHSLAGYVMDASPERERVCVCVSVALTARLLGSLYLLDADADCLMLMSVTVLCIVVCGPV